MYSKETVATKGCIVHPDGRANQVPLEIEGVAYSTAADMHRDLGITRQTLWRWRKAGKIPRGHRFRNRQIVFTRQEVEAIREYANRLEPAEPAEGDQLKLFNSGPLKRTL